jgi:hypothetical protein
MEICTVEHCFSQVSVSELDTLKIYSAQVCVLKLLAAEIQTLTTLNTWRNEGGRGTTAPGHLSASLALGLGPVRVQLGR